MDKKNETIKLYEDDALLYELGCIYHELAKILDEEEREEVFINSAFPMMSLHDLIETVIAYGMPEELHMRLCAFYEQIEVNDWTSSMNECLPVEKRFPFVCGLTGLRLKTFEDEIQERNNGICA